MKKVLVITNHSYMLYRFRRELIQELMKSCEVILSMPFVGHEDDFQAMGLRCIDTQVDRRGVNPGKDLKLFHTYRRLIKQEKPDLVITYSIKPNIYGGIACSMEGIPFYANVQGLGTAFQKNGLAQFVTMLYRIAFRKVEMVFFENQENARVFLDRSILSPQKVTVLPGAGINLTDYSLADYPEHDVVHFLYLGRIMKEKGMDELFAAMRKLYAAYRGKAVLDLVGFFDDDYKAEIDQLVSDGAAVFHGFQTDPRPYYQDADCVVLPSYHEGMSNVLLEAAAIGRPIITSNIPGCREAVDNGITGLLVEARNENDLYAAMETMIRMPADQRKTMGINGHQKMCSQFDKAKVVTQTLAALMQTV